MSFLPSLLAPFTVAPGRRKRPPLTAVLLATILGWQAEADHPTINNCFLSFRPFDTLALLNLPQAASLPAPILTVLGSTPLPDTRREITGSDRTFIVPRSIFNLTWSKAKVSWPGALPSGEILSSMLVLSRYLVSSVHDKKLRHLRKVQQVFHFRPRPGLWNTIEPRLAIPIRRRCQGGGLLFSTRVRYSSKYPVIVERLCLRCQTNKLVFTGLSGFQPLHADRRDGYRAIGLASNISPAQSPARSGMVEFQGKRELRLPQDVWGVASLKWGWGIEYPQTIHIESRGGEDTKLGNGKNLGIACGYRYKEIRRSKIVYTRIPGCRVPLLGQRIGGSVEEMRLIARRGRNGCVKSGVKWRSAPIMRWYGDLLVSDPASFVAPELPPPP